MNRAVAAILGVFLFCMGLFLGMVGSFFQTLPTSVARLPEAAARSTNTVTQKIVQPPPPAARKPPAPVLEEPTESVESALVDALRTLAVALASQPAPPPAQPVATVEAEVAPDPTVAVLEEPPAPETTVLSPEPAAAQPSPPPSGGHWAYDDRMGWLWMPDGAPPYVAVPAVEVYPGGFVTVRPGSRRGSSPGRGTLAARPAVPSSSVIDPIVPNSSRAPAWSPFSNRVKSRVPPASQRPQSSVIDPRVSGNNRMPAWFQETRK